VFVTEAGKLRILASGTQPINIAYCLAIADYLTSLLAAKTKHKQDHAGYLKETQRMSDESKKRNRVHPATIPQLPHTALADGLTVATNCSC
jgi:hypothetical protein